MFNLIVKYNAWQPNRDTIARERVFEYTDDALTERFNILKRGAEPVMELPTLFMEEMGDARVGRLIGVRGVGKDYELQYAYDPNIPPLSYSDMEDLSSLLQIHDWEFSRTHWAIKEPDLFYALLNRKDGRNAQPKVFDLGDGPVDNNLVSVMMPFAAEFDTVYTTLRAAATDVRKNCQRADDIWRHDAVIQDIVSLICTSQVVICDLTGRNPNVFYETGIAHTLGKEVILITQSEHDVPFNLRHLRYVKYLRNNEGLESLREQVVNRLRTLDTALKR